MLPSIKQAKFQGFSPSHSSGELSVIAEIVRIILDQQQELPSREHLASLYHRFLVTVLTSKLPFVSSPDVLSSDGRPMTLVEQGFLLYMIVPAAAKTGSIRNAHAFTGYCARISRMLVNTAIHCCALRSLSEEYRTYSYEMICLKLEEDIEIYDTHEEAEYAALVGGIQEEPEDSKDLLQGSSDMSSTQQNIPMHGSG